MKIFTALLTSLLLICFFEFAHASAPSRPPEENWLAYNQKEKLCAVVDKAILQESTWNELVNKWKAQNWQIEQIFQVVTINLPQGEKTLKSSEVNSVSDFCGKIGLNYKKHDDLIYGSTGGIKKLIYQQSNIEKYCLYTKKGLAIDWGNNICTESLEADLSIEVRDTEPLNADEIVSYAADKENLCRINLDSQFKEYIPIVSGATESLSQPCDYSQNPEECCQKIGLKYVKNLDQTILKQLIINKIISYLIIIILAIIVIVLAIIKLRKKITKRYE